jgi:calcium permeable stress-gated cation channel
MLAQDAIEFYTRKLARTEAAVQEWREKSEFNKVENYGFASLAAVPYAHIVAQRLAGKHPKGTTIALAPNPKDIVCGLSETE